MGFICNLETGGGDDEQDNEEEDEEEGREVRGLEQRRRAITLALFEIWWFGYECNAGNR